MYRSIFSCLIVLALTVSCSPNLTRDFVKDPVLAKKLENWRPVYPAFRFLVMSDLHYYDLDLGTNGNDFREYLDNDRKLLVESSQILDKAVEEFSKIPAEFVLVCGDLSKDGELVNHRKVAEKLARIAKSGKKVLVINGNHDIWNGQAYQFTGERQEPVSNVSPDDFTNIYWNDGYSSAIDRDTNSLSYVSEPVPGVRVLAVDACRYRENVRDREHVIPGKIVPGTLAWLENVLKDSVTAGKVVIVMMHHGALEHYSGQKEFYGEYVVDDNEKIASLLASYGVRLVFTGHFHAQDVTMTGWNDSPGSPFLADVETGSLVTWPCPYRLVTVTTDQTVTIRSRSITSIPSRPAGFQEYGREYVRSGISGMAYRTLLKYGLSPAEGSNMAPQIAEAFLAHYRGDENPGTNRILDTDHLGFWSGIVVSMRRKLIEGLWKDLPPADNDITISLKDGKTAGQQK